MAPQVFAYWWWPPLCQDFRESRNQKRRRIEVGKTLGQVDGSVLLGDAGLFADDGFRETAHSIRWLHGSSGIPKTYPRRARMRPSRHLQRGDVDFLHR
jgi:hypothetical protein